MDGDSVAITMYNSTSEYRFSDIVFHDSVLTFKWNPGGPMECDLVTRGDRSYAGSCRSQDPEIEFPMHITATSADGPHAPTAVKSAVGQSPFP